MKISTKGIYAIRFMIFLAQNEKSAPIPLKDIAKATDISKKYLEQIALSLTTAQLVHSIRGASGGYHLAKKPQNISMLDILTVTEGSLAPVEYLNILSDESSSDEMLCEMFVWRDLHRVIKEYLSNVSLQDIIEHSSQLAADSYSI